MHQPTPTAGDEPEFRCPMLGCDTTANEEQTEMQQDRPTVTGFRIGPFSIGDLIALGGVAFVAGASFFQIGALQRDADVHRTADRAEKDRLMERVQAIEQIIPSEYVRRVEYREDLKEIKGLFEDIRTEIRGKVDRQQ